MKLLKLREDRQARVLAAGQIELIGPKGRAVVKVDGEPAQLLFKLREGLTQPEIENLPRPFRTLVIELAKHGFLIFADKNATRTSAWIAHVSESPFAVDRLEASAVVIIGCGGTGSVLADHLVRIGIRRFVLVDDAVLDLPDMNRQLPYTFADIGALKVSALGAHLREFGAEVHELPHKLDSEEASVDLAQQCSVDLVFCCADTPPYLVQIWTSRLSSMLRCPVVFGSVGMRDYVVGPLLVAEAHKEAFEADRLEVSSRTDPRIMMSSACINNTLAAVEQAWLGIRYLLDPAEVTIQGLDNQSTIVDIFNGNRRTISWSQRTTAANLSGL